MKDDDSRFTAGLLFDVFEVLEKHGYRKKLNNAGHARALLLLLELVMLFEGQSENT